MTNLQVKYAEQQETVRANKAREHENRQVRRENTRHNQEVERDRREQTAETKRDNRVKNKQGWWKVGSDVAKTIVGSRGVVGLINDPKWYAQDPTLLEDAGRLNFNNPLGEPLLQRIQGSNSLGVTAPMRTPGIFIFDTVPAIDVAKNSLSPINQASKNLYKTIKNAITPNPTYQHMDLMISTLCGCELASAIAWMARTYGILQTFRQKNRYLNKMLLRSLGFNADDLLKHQADLLFFINYCIRQYNEHVFVPEKFTYWNRAVWRYSNVFADSESPKASMYALRPMGFYKFKVTTYSTAEVKPLKYTIFDNENDRLLTYSDIVDYVSDLFDDFTSNDDLGNMMGDLLHAFGNNGVHKLSYIPENFEVVPGYSKEALLQFHNATILTSKWSLDDETWVMPFTIDQDPAKNILTYQPSIPARSYCTLPSATGSIALDLIDGIDNSSEMVIEASRSILLSGGIVTDGVGGGNISLASIGADIFFRAFMYVLTQDGSLDRYIFPIALVENGYGDDQINLYNLKNIALLSKFDHAPRVFLGSLDQSTEQNMVTASDVIWDVDNATLLPASVLEKLNLTANLSMFDVPVEHRGKY